MRHLDLAALRSLVAIAETQGVTRAAAQVNLTQSAVSMQIKRLEHATGSQLLVRQGRGVVLTDAAEQLVAYGRQLLAINDEAWSRLTHDDYEGELLLGVPADLVYPQIPYVLRQAKQRYPRIRVSLLSDLTAVLKKQFDDGEIDLILTTEPGRRRDAETLIEAEQHWWGAHGGRAHRQRPLPVALRNNCALRPDLVKTLGKAGISWDFVSTTDTDASVNAMVSADLAVTAAVGTQIVTDCERITDGSLPALGPIKINLYTDKSRNPALTEKLADIVREAYQHQSGDALAVV